MRGKMNALTERRIGTAIIAGALDEETWDVASITAAKGWIMNAFYYDPVEDNWNGSDPPTVGAGEMVGIRLVGYNSTDYPQQMHWVVRFINPAGTVVKTFTPTAETVGSHGTISSGHCEYIPTIQGTWTYDAELWSDSTDMAHKGGTLAIVGTAAAEGHIDFYHVYDETDGRQYLETDLPAEIPLDHEVVAGVTAYNDTDYQQTLTCTVEFIDPDGSKVGTHSTTRVLGAGEHFVPISEYTVLDKAGIWKVHAVLEG